ncbi:MAG: hypothetical protein GSR80_001083 [Desulfurococcales archaeon]|nr:hypothetical protein [Desulfurococcales archaeon]
MPGAPQVEAGEARLEPIVDILAFFAAMGNYGYLDVLGNALERTTALEALGNALRDYRSTCLDASPEQRRRLEAEEGVRCPRLGPGDLEAAVREFEEVTREKERSGELVVLLREIYVRALARASRFKVGGSGGGR